MFIEFEKYQGFMIEALKSISDKKDSPYLALALKMNSSIWSNDKHLKEQDKISVLTTFDLINILG